MISHILTSFSLFSLIFRKAAWSIGRCFPPSLPVNQIKRAASCSSKIYRYLFKCSTWGLEEDVMGVMGWVKGEAPWYDEVETRQFHRKMPLIGNYLYGCTDYRDTRYRSIYVLLAICWHIAILKIGNCDRRKRRRTGIAPFVSILKQQMVRKIKGVAVSLYETDKMRKGE